MRSSSPIFTLAFTFLLLLSLLLSLSSAQQPPRTNNTDVIKDLDSMLTCMKCLSKAGLAQVPACKTLQDNPATSGVPVDKLDETQRQCYCGLITATEWTKSCFAGSGSSPQQQCNATIVDTFLQGFAYVKPYVCPTQNLSGQKSGAQGRAVVIVLEVSAWMTVLALTVVSVLL